MRIDIYSAALYARKDGKINYTSFVFTAINDDEATGIALKRCKEIFSDYEHHGVAVNKCTLRIDTERA